MDTLPEEKIAVILTEKSCSKLLPNGACDDNYGWCQEWGTWDHLERKKNEHPFLFCMNRRDYAK